MTKEKPEEPKDLGVKIGSKKRKFLEDIRDKLREEKETCEYTAELDKGFLEVINKAIDIEKEKFK